MILDVLADISLQSWLIIIYAAGFTLLSSVFHYRSFLEKTADDFRAFILYFTSFFVLLFAIPFDFILIAFPKPLAALKGVGFQFGNFDRGIWIILTGIPITALLVFVSTKDPGIKKHYPFSKSACESPRKFILYEMAYLVLYYLPWEFTFRGVFLFTLIGWMGQDASGIIAAVMIQTIVATVYHLGHPDIEVIGAFVGSIIFGVIAYVTQSILYTLLLHALIGILNDTVIYFRHYKRNRRD